MNDYQKYYDSLDKKPMGAGALFFNNKKELLILKPTYKNYWSIPGGVVDKNESPLEACTREIKEELALNIKIKKLLCMSYYHIKNKKGESIQFMFWGGILNSKQIAKIKLPEDEISEFKFVKIKDALNLVSENMRKRMQMSSKALKNNTISYFEK